MAQSGAKWRKGEARFDEQLSGDRQRVLAILDVSRETSERLDVYVTLLLKWQPVINLVSPSALGGLWTRHILDSGQILGLATPHKSWADLGSGAGFPGLVLAILSMQGAGVRHFHLVESDERKAGFLREAARLTGAPVEIHAERAQEVLSRLQGKVSAVTARALAPLPRLLALGEPLLTTGAEGFFPKGLSIESEIQEAAEIFAFDYRAVPSQSDEKGRILVIRDLRRRGPLGKVGDGR